MTAVSEAHRSRRRRTLSHATVAMMIVALTAALTTLVVDRHHLASMRTSVTLYMLMNATPLIMLLEPPFLWREHFQRSRRSMWRLTVVNVVLPVALLATMGALLNTQPDTFSWSALYLNVAFAVDLVWCVAFVRQTRFNAGSLERTAP
jgi:hypothetical protein